MMRFVTLLKLEIEKKILSKFEAEGHEFAKNSHKYFVTKIVLTYCVILPLSTPSRVILVVLDLQSLQDAKLGEYEPVFDWFKKFYDAQNYISLHQSKTSNSHGHDKFSN